MLDSLDDSDGDGLMNQTEQLVGSNPGVGDSNGDGKADDKDDTDGDGVPNGTEQQLGSNPASGDTNGDGIDDGRDDADGDGFANADEVAAGTLVNAADSKPVLPPPPDTPPVVQPQDMPVKSPDDGSSDDVAVVTLPDPDPDPPATCPRRP